MKIKHWAGYGAVNAKKISSDANTLVVVVWGDHERGIDRDDKYDVYNWLVTRFDKSRADWSDVVKVELRPEYRKTDKGYDEYCTYTIHFRHAS